MASTTRGGLWSSGSTCPGAVGTGEGPGARRRLLFLAVMPPCPPQTSLGSCQGASPTRGGGGSSCGSSPTGPRGRWKGRAPIPRAYLGADFYFWLLCLDTPPRLSGGPDEAVVRHQRTSGGVGRAGRHVRERRPHESTEKNCKMRKFSQLQSHYQNAKIFTLSMMRKFFYSWVGPRRPVAVGRSDAGRGSLRPLASHNSKCF